MDQKDNSYRKSTIDRRLSKRQKSLVEQEGLAALRLSGTLNFGDQPTETAKWKVSDTPTIIQ